MWRCGFHGSPSRRPLSRRAWGLSAPRNHLWDQWRMGSQEPDGELRDQWVWAMLVQRWAPSGGSGCLFLEGR